MTVLRPALLSLVATTAIAAGPIPEGWFVWPMVEQKTGAATDVAFLNRAPAGRDGRIQVVNGKFALPNGERVRFWGANLTSGENFPATAEEAAFIARHLSKSGVNIARLHHLDNPWGVAKGGSIWKADDPRRQEFDPVQLDRLHRLMTELKKAGVFININLKCSKALSAADGFPESVVKFPDFQKRVDIYDERMGLLQKDYARKLLTTPNPYTGLAPVDDPAVAIIEINNENSLLGYWTANIGHGFDRFPVEFQNSLLVLWNKWLVENYGARDAVAGAWNRTGGISETVVGEDYAWSENRAAGVEMTVDRKTKGQIDITVAKTGGIDWQAQVYAGGLSLREGEAYTIEFEARADNPRDLRLLLGADTLANPNTQWREMGYSDYVKLTPEWTKVRKVFIAHSIAGTPARLDLNLGMATGSLSVRNIKLSLGAEGIGLKPEEDPAKGNVGLPLAPSGKQWSDWIQFLAETERTFADEMRRFLREDLRVTAPITFTQIEYGGLTGVHRETGSDFADAHAYWQHPDFGAANDWDGERWTIKNSPQLSAVTDRNFQELGAMALRRIKGKPYTISEYDHPAPSEFVAEMYPLVAAFGAVQDWDGIYPFCHGTYGSADKDGRISSYFDQQHHPAKWGQSAFATLIFRRGDIPAATSSTTLRLPRPVWSASHHAALLWQFLEPQAPYGFLFSRLSVDENPLPGNEQARLEREGPTSQGKLQLADGNRGRYATICTPKASAVFGFIGDTVCEIDGLKATVKAFGRNFAAISIVSLDGEPVAVARQSLVTVVARAENQDMIWNETRTSVGKRWGHGPTLAEFVPAEISVGAAAGAKVFALAPDGSRSAEVKATYSDNRLTFSTDPKQPTLHYEIVR
ncbi:MAG: carbohydrate binding domain-containing protein [Opitutaceae bacterium]|nr:carbohydrate binding domain-containing protein [Opitutaceae bacterium]